LFARAITDLKIESREEFTPPGLSTIKWFRGHEVLEIFVIGLDCDLMLSSDKFRSPFLKGAHNSEHFLVVNVVIALGRRELFREICYRA
jgi:hypothetical protein